jgi:hypothetical protein
MNYADAKALESVMNPLTTHETLQCFEDGRSALDHAMVTSRGLLYPTVPRNSTQRSFDIRGVPFLPRHRARAARYV